MVSCNFSQTDSDLWPLRRARYCLLDNYPDVLSQITAYSPINGPTTEQVNRVNWAAWCTLLASCFFVGALAGLYAGQPVVRSATPYRSVVGNGTHGEWGLWSFKEWDASGRWVQQNSGRTACTYTVTTLADETAYPAHKMSIALQVPNCAALNTARATFIMLSLLLQVLLILTHNLGPLVRQPQLLDDFYAADVDSDGTDVYTSTTITPLPPRAPHPTRDQMIDFHIAQKRQLLDKIQVRLRRSHILLAVSVVVALVSMICLGVFTHPSSLDDTDVLFAGWFWYPSNIALIAVASVQLWQHRRAVQKQEAVWQGLTGHQQEDVARRNHHSYVQINWNDGRESLLPAGGGSSGETVG